MAKSKYVLYSFAEKGIEVISTDSRQEYLSMLAGDEPLYYSPEEAMIGTIKLLMSRIEKLEERLQ